MLDEARLRDFETRLRKQNRTKIPQTIVWRAFASAFPGRPPAEERELLALALDTLEQRGTLALPSRQGSAWDKALHPPIPRTVTLQREKPAARQKLWRTHAWHPRLAWIVDMPHLTAGQMAFLTRLNAALIRGDLEHTAPLKYRSLQLCETEKDLAPLLQSSLFAEGRLSREMLNIEPEVLPLAWHAVRPDGGRVLIVENAATFHVARAVLDTTPDAPYDILAFGGGNGILQSIPYLHRIGRTITLIHYCGDLDREGVHIARAAAASAAEARLPRVEPATQLHALMLAQRARFDHPAGWKDEAQERRATSDLAAASWLDATIREDVERMLRAGLRVPEEVLGPRELQRIWS